MWLLKTPALGSQGLRKSGKINTLRQQSGSRYYSIVNVMANDANTEESQCYDEYSMKNIR